MKQQAVPTPPDSAGQETDPNDAAVENDMMSTSTFEKLLTSCQFFCCKKQVV